MPDPSRANWDPDQPRECSVCGRLLRVTKDRIWFRRYPVKETYCDDCTAKYRLVRISA